MNVVDYNPIKDSAKGGSTAGSQISGRMLRQKVVVRLLLVLATDGGPADRSFG